MSSDSESYRLNQLSWPRYIRELDNPQNSYLDKTRWIKDDPEGAERYFKDIIEEPNRRLVVLRGTYIPHSIEDPAIIEYYDDGTISHIRYMVFGIAHRDGPDATWFDYDKNGVLSEVRWIKNGKITRGYDLPARTTFKNGVLVSNFWYINDKLDREDGKPAWIMYYPDGSIEKEVFYKNGKYLKEYDY